MFCTIPDASGSTNPTNKESIMNEFAGVIQSINNNTATLNGTRFGMGEESGCEDAAHVADVIDECMSDGWLTESSGWDEVSIKTYGMEHDD
jgi:hypothetical protein